MFTVGVQIEENHKELLETLKQNHGIFDDSFDSSENQLGFSVKLSSGETSAFLSHLSQKGRINHFEENVPSANDIFIQAVNQKNGHE